VNKIANFLNQHIDGNVYISNHVLDAFSTDKSIMKIRPKFVAQPTSTTEIRKLVRFSHQLAKRNVGVGVTVRGSGNDKTGAAIGPGIVISTTKLNRVCEIDVRQRLIRTEAGITLGELEAALEAVGLTLPISADPSHTIGGLIMNGHTGDLSGKYGSILKYIEQAEIVLSDGEIVRTELLSRRALRKKKEQKDLEGSIYRTITSLIENNPALMEELKKKPGLSGYRNINQLFLGRRFDLLPLLVASQGTLGIMTEVILRCEYISPNSSYFTIAFKNLADALTFGDVVQKYDPASVDFYDLAIFDETAVAGKPMNLISKLPSSGYLISASFDNYKKRQRKRIIRKLSKKYKPTSFATAVDGPSHETILKNIIGTYLNSTSARPRLPLIDGAKVDIDYLAEYLEGVGQLEEKHKLSLPVFGSLATGTYSVRPGIDISTTSGRRETLDLLRDYTDMLYKIGGTICGDSPEGRFKAIYSKEYADAPALKELDQAVKEAFDPHGVLNPGVKIDANTRSSIRNLRTNPGKGIIKE